MTENEQLKGVHFTKLNADKFKRCRVSINFIWDSERNTATASALLPYLLQRGYSECPDMTKLSKLLAKLYGASLSVDTTVCGAARVLTVAVTGIKSEYAINGEDLAAQYAHLAAGIAFSPYLLDGIFDKAALDIEREKLRNALLGEINEKRIYCVKQARRKFFGDAKEGIERSGYIDELDGISVREITAVYNNMLSTARIEVLVMGIDENPIKREISQYITNVKREPCAAQIVSAQHACEEKSYTQSIEAVQGKLCLLFTTDTPIEAKYLAAMQVAIALYGGTPTSRLFTNVREKESLCYYCSAGYSRFTNMLSVDSGIEPSNAAKAKAAILRELNALKTGEITQKELADTKLCLVNSLKSVDDALVILDSWTFSELIAGTMRTTDKAIAAIKAVEIDDIKYVLSRLSLSVSYLLTKEDE